MKSKKLLQISNFAGAVLISISWSEPALGLSNINHKSHLFHNPLVLCHFCTDEHVYMD